MRGREREEKLDDPPRQQRHRHRDRILDVAELLVQRRGFNGFSYAHIAAELGITKASLHYHFAGKAELGEALIAPLRRPLRGGARRIDADGADAPRQLTAYADSTPASCDGQRMCLCGMLAAEYETLPARWARDRPLLRRQRELVDGCSRTGTGRWDTARRGVGAGGRPRSDR